MVDLAVAVVDLGAVEGERFLVETYCVLNINEPPQNSTFECIVILNAHFVLVFQKHPRNPRTPEESPRSQTKLCCLKLYTQNSVVGRALWQARQP